MFGVIISVPIAAVIKILAQEFVLPPLEELAATPKTAAAPAGDAGET
jgi:hypothetical protein